jgi:glyoxylase-like metal-dependent hydrolase (beta-lactamase superfamily II)
MGAAWRYGSYFAGSPDIAPVYSFLCLPAFRRAMARAAGLEASSVALPHRLTKVLPMEDGHTFDLGGRTVRAISVPGHTAGSMAFVDEDAGIVLTGDDVNPDLWMHLPGCTSLETWRAGADRILGLLRDGLTGWYGHGLGLQTLEQVEETRRLVDELIAKRASGEVGRGRGSYPSDDAGIVIRYR